MAVHVEQEDLEMENLNTSKSADSSSAMIAALAASSNRPTSNGHVNPAFALSEEEDTKSKSSNVKNLHVPQPQYRNSSPSLSNGYTNRTTSNGSVRWDSTSSFKENALSSDPDEYLKQKQRSLPIPGTIYTVSHSSPSLMSNGTTKANINGKKLTSRSQPSSPTPKNGFSSSLKLPWVKSRVSDLSAIGGEGSRPTMCPNNSRSTEKRSSVPTSPKYQLRSLVTNLLGGFSTNNKILPVSSISGISNSSQTLQPPTPLPLPTNNKRNRLDSFAPNSDVERESEINFSGRKCCSLSRVHLLFNNFKKRANQTIDPSGTLWLCWLALVAFAFVYNSIVIFYRSAFLANSPETVPYWLAFDYFCDLIYLLDIAFRSNLSFKKNGLPVEDKKLTRKHYMSHPHFKYDLLSLLPCDLLYLKIGFQYTLCRLPRLFKVRRYFEFTEKFEFKAQTAYLFRVARTVGYMLYMIHLNTCCYYYISRYEGIGVNNWVYNGEGNAYVRCLYRATKTLIVIGNLPTPETTFEIFFMNLDFGIGVFVFAAIIGQMRDILGAAGETKATFRRRMDSTMELMQNWKIPKPVQERVRQWFMYTWDRGELLDEQEVMEFVPTKMQTDLAIHVHLATLSKVSLFQDCDKMLLRDLVLKLRPVLFLPGDYICRKGEVGKEMYIVNSGHVQVLGGEDGKKILATLHAGSVFGEISLLSLGSGNRRTANVFSPGFSNLFVLSKQNLQEAVVNYPEAQESLKKKAEELLKQNEKNGTIKSKRRGKSLIQESIIKRTRSPAFFNAVLEVARPRRISATILKVMSSQKEDSFSEFSLSDCSDSSSYDTEEELKRLSGKRRKLPQVKEIRSRKNSRDTPSSQYKSPQEDGQPVKVVVNSPPKERRLSRSDSSDFEVTTKDNESSSRVVGLGSSPTPYDSMSNRESDGESEYSNLSDMLENILRDEAQSGSEDEYYGSRRESNRECLTNPSTSSPGYHVRKESGISKENGKDTPGNIPEMNGPENNLEKKTHENVSGKYTIKNVPVRPTTKDRTLQNNEEVQEGVSSLNEEIIEIVNEQTENEHYNNLKKSSQLQQKSKEQPITVESSPVKVKKKLLNKSSKEILEQKKRSKPSPYSQKLTAKSKRKP